MRKLATIAIAGILLSGCTSTLKPIGHTPNYSAFDNGGQLTGCGWPQGMSLQELVSPERSGERSMLTLVREDGTPTGAGQMQQVQEQGTAVSRLDWLSCEMLAKSMSNMSQAGYLRNRNEWRDIPLIGSAITAAALVLFGNRTADGDLTSGSTDVIEGLALGTGGFALLANYLDPDQAADLLYKSAAGHRCLAEHGQAVATYGNLAIGRDAVAFAEELRTSAAALRTMAMQHDVSTAEGLDQRTRALAAADRADRALAFYQRQRTAREVAPAQLYLASYDFSMKLSQAARREAVQIGDLQTTLAASIRAQTEQSDVARPADDGATAFRGGDIDSLTGVVDRRSAAFAEALPNIAALVAQFDACTALAFLGQPLPRPQITFTGDGS